MLSKIASSAALQSAGLGLLFFDRLILSAILMRIWGVAMFEDWSLLLATAGMLNLLDFGLHQTFSNAYTRHYQSGNLIGFSRQMAIALALMGIIALTGAAGFALWIASGLWHDAVAISTAPSAEAAVALLLLGFAFLVQTATGVTSPIYRGQDRFSRGLALELANGATRLLVMMLVALLGGGFIAVAAGYLLATVATSANMVRDQLVQLSGVTLRPRLPSRSELATVARVAPWFYLQHASNVLLLGVPLLVIGQIGAATGSLAAFAVLRTLTNFVRQACQILANSSAVELSRHWFESADMSLTQGRMQRSCQFIAVGAGVQVGSLFPILDQIFMVWSGGRVEPQLDVAAIFCIGVALTAPGMLIGTFLTYIDDARIGAYSRLVSIVVAAFAGGVLAERYQLVGVALALILGEMIGHWLLYMPAAERWTGVNRYVLALRWLGLSLAGAAPVCIIGTLITWNFTGAASVALYVSLIPIISGLLVVMVGLSATDRLILLAAIRRRLRLLVEDNRVN